MNNIKELYLTYPVEKLFYDLTKDIVIKVDEKEYPNKIFYLKNDKWIFDYNKNNGKFYCNYYEYWSKFYKKFEFNYYQIRDLTKDMIEKHFKLKRVTPDWMIRICCSKIEKHFKLKGVTPINCW